MKKRKIYFFVALAITLITIILLVTGSSILLISVDEKGNLPIGNLITWAGMIALPCAIYYGIDSFNSPQGKWQHFLSKLLKTIIILAILWVPVSFLLSGNLSFTFSQKPDFQGGQLAMKIFWIYSYSVTIGALSIIILHWVSILVNKIMDKK
jgi:hypothetical protein